MASTLDADYLIVGAGLAGLSCALKLSKRYPKAKILIAELYTYVGGRVVSYHPKHAKGLVWENGAGRIPDSHTLVHDLLRRYKIPTYPLSQLQEWRPAATGEPQKDPWPVLAATIFHAIQFLPQSTLATHTVYELAVQLFGATKANELCLHFPYRAEMKLLRADLALRSFTTGTLSSKEKYTVIPGGLSTLTAAIRKDLESRGVQFLFGHRLVALGPETMVPTALKFEIKQEKKFKTLYATKVILALHVNALRGVNPFQNLPVLKHLEMDPLLRTYAIFPTHQGHSWFSKIPRTVTDSPIRFFIPVNPAKGVAMVSYTEGEDAKRWMSVSNQKGEKGLSQEILKELKVLFPKESIPNPLFFKEHPWTDGCTYWTPGLYKPEEETKKILRPFPTRWPNVYVCGESYSLCQTWIQGALEHADLLCSTYLDC